MADDLVEIFSCDDPGIQRLQRVTDTQLGGLVRLEDEVGRLELDTRFQKVAESRCVRVM